ncbi:tetratricopeptide repeat protein [Marinoscillum sp.]|uniref:CHAT domain-containing tetratricopeptide repeat protein n=1 Tax=Marinoscillum sp. TaxID=2024838 RepID=UPI003BAD2EC1
MKRLILTLTFSLACLLAISQDWATLYQQSVDAYNNYESQEARNLAERALSLIRNENSGASTNEAVILRQLSLVCYDLGDDDGATAYAKEEVELLIEIGANQDMNFANALQNLAVSRMYRSEYKAAEPLLSQALEIALTYNSEDSYEVAVLRGNMGIVLFHLKEDERARELFESSISSMNNYEEITSDYYNIVYNYGSLLAEKGNYAGALPYYEALENYYNYDTPNYEYGSILVNIGDVLDELGRFNDAVEKYQLAIDNFRSMGEENSDEYGIALNNLSIDLQKVGRFDEAANLMKELISQKEGSSKSYASTLTNYANLLIRKGDMSAAKEKLQQVQTLYAADSVSKDITYIGALESLSGVLLSEGNPKEAASMIETALTVATENGIDKKLYSLNNQKAKILTSQAKYADAKRVAEIALEKALAIYGTEALQTAFVKNTLAGVYTQLGNYDLAEELYLAVLPIFRKAYGDQHPEYATVAANYSSLLQLQGNYYTAEYYLKIAEQIKLNTFGKDNLDYLTTYENLALLYLNTARYTEAELILEDILAVKKGLLEPDDPSIGYSLTNLGSVNKQLAEYADAESYLKKARKIYTKAYGENHIFYASVVNNLALLYQKMGNLEAARPLFEQALAVYEEQIGKLNPDYATALENLATLYQLEGDLDKAKELLEEALKIDEQILGQNHPLYSKTLHNLASIYEKDDDFERAKELYTRSLDIDRNVFGKNHPSYASTLYNLAVLEQELENYEQARTYYQQVADIRKAILGANHPDYAYSLYGLASVLHKTGSFEEAKPLYLDVTNQYLEFIGKYFPALSESEKSAFYGKIKPVFDSYYDFIVDYYLLKKGTEEDRQELVGSMYNLQLSTKALLLNASNKVRNTILSSGDESLIALFNDWIALKENIVKAYSMSKEELESSHIDIAQLETEANNQEKELSLKSSAFAGAFDNDQPTWNQVQEKLNEGEAAIEIIRIKKKMKTDSVLYIGLLLEPEQLPKMIVKPNGIYMEDKGFKTYKNSVIYKLEDLKSYDVFWKEYDQEIAQTVNTIYLSADGVLNKVNIATLYNPDTKEYLLDRYSLRLLSNTRELIEEQPDTEGSQEAVMFGYPKYYLSDLEQAAMGTLIASADMERSFGSEIAELPGTLKEIQEIEKVVSGGDWNVQTYLSIAATEEEVKSIASPKILHIATHGFFLEDIKTKEDEGLTSRNAKFNPLLRSGLLLAGAQNTVKNEELAGEEDGILTAYEVMNLNLDNTQLVVMSACETGLGEVKNGEGVYGLQRSFIVAGADNLVMSLWKVNDQTTQMLMTGFYENWFNGQSKLDAFNNAIAAVRNEFKDPYYWGAFVMLGK